MKPEEKKELSFEDVEAWILANRKDTDLMDDINRLTYPYTSKYAEQVARGR